jgi:ABC-2 type transport system permease protein
VLRDIGLLYRMELVPSLRTPAWIVIGLLQPVLYLLLFGPLTEQIAANLPGFPPGGAWVVFTPALIVQLALFSSSFTGFGLLADLKGGVVERLRVTPASRVALLLGKVLTNATHTMVQATLIILLAVLVFDLRGGERDCRGSIGTWKIAWATRRDRPRSKPDQAP